MVVPAIKYEENDLYEGNQEKGLGEEKWTIVMEELTNGKINAKTPANQKKRQPPEIPDIKLPFPPVVTAYEVFQKCLTRKCKSPNAPQSEGKKAPNKFLIYRVVFVMELHRQNLYHSMTDISGIIGRSWKKESKHVQDAYGRIATEVEALNKSHYGEYSKKKANKKGQVKSSSSSISHMVPLNSSYSGSLYDNNNILAKISPPNPYNNNHYNNYNHNNYNHFTTPYTSQLYQPPSFYLTQPFQDDYFKQEYFKQEYEPLTDNNLFSVSS